MLQRDLHHRVKKDYPDSLIATSKTKDLYKLKPMHAGKEQSNC